MHAEKVRFETSDGLVLEGRFASPHGARMSAVICHPHPLHEGSMSSILVPTLQRALAADGVAALRFNFRGVGESEGGFHGEEGEVLDARAALDFASTRAQPVAMMGWSFGALAGLAAAANDARVSHYVAIAPPLSVTGIALPPAPEPSTLTEWRARMLGICGTADHVCTPDDLKRWMAHGDVEVIDGADHMFTGARERLCEIVVGFLR